MDIDAIKQMINEVVELDALHVKFDGSHAEVIAAGACFIDLNRVKRQQVISKALKPAIESGAIHAVSIRTFTPEQWEKDKKLLLLS